MATNDPPKFDQRKGDAAKAFYKADAEALRKAAENANNRATQKNDKAAGDKVKADQLSKTQEGPTAQNLANKSKMEANVAKAEATKATGLAQDAAKKAQTLKP